MPQAPSDAAAGRGEPAPAAPTEVPAPVRIGPTIIIDPGHGGDDTGTKAPRGVEEKQLTLDIARRLRALLESRLGARAVLTRDTDVAVALDARAAVANVNGGELFLSIHANAAPSSTVEGAEVYFLPTDNESASAGDTADLSATQVPAVGGTSRRLALVPWDFAHARHAAASARFATVLAESLAARVPVGPSPIRTAPLRVLQSVNMPAALVEVGFLSSPTQQKLMAGDEFKTTAAQALFDAIAEFRREPEAPRGR